MAIHNSVLKRERQNEVRRSRNRVVKSKVHSAFRKINEEIFAKKTENLEKLLKSYHSEVDKAVKKGIFHRNKAARLKSNMVKKVKAVKS